MDVQQPRVFDRIVDPATVEIAFDEYRAVERDVHVASERGHPGVPTANWLTLSADTDPSSDIRADFPMLDCEAFEERYGTLAATLTPFLGGRQQLPATRPEAAAYLRLFARWDPLGLWRNVSEEVRAQLRIADLGTILDATLLGVASSNPGQPTSTVLEIGGGYGRFAEAVLNVFGSSVRYVIVDATPLALCYSYAYLRQAVPAVEVGSSCRGDPFDLDRFQCFITTPWALPEDLRIDWAVSVNSLQEMTQAAVDYYLGLIDRRAKLGALIYSNNAHDYIFQGTWSIPVRWRRLLMGDTPRSWSRVHPTELFEVTDADHSAWNATLEALYALAKVD